MRGQIDHRGHGEHRGEACQPAVFHSATSAFEQSSAICLCVLCDLCGETIAREKWAEAHATWKGGMKRAGWIARSKNSNPLKGRVPCYVVGASPGEFRHLSI
jgi:hypothetical protein